MIVLGIDPGMAHTGYGIVAVDGGRLRAVEHGSITTSAREAAERRLAHLYRQMAGLIARHEPGAVALEELFVGANPRTILSVGQARGAVLAACGTAGVGTFGYAPAEIKTGVCGFGRADKRQVVHMVCSILALSEPPGSFHAADALAVAVCHAHTVRVDRREPAAAR
jgi:crossover junction endodeoxyribonuclease RuvC